MDFTVADSSPREHLAPENHRASGDWKAWNRQAHLDVPIQHTINILMSLHSIGYEICFATVRSDDGFDETIRWLEAHGLPANNLYMRVEGDHRDACCIKEELLGEISHEFNVLTVFDDDPKVVEHLRSLDYKVLQV